MDTLAEKIAAHVSTLDGPRCNTIPPSMAKSAKEQYAKNPAQFFISVIRYTNRPKCMEVLRGLGRQIADLLDDGNPIKIRLLDLANGENIQAHRDWYYQTKKIGIGSPVEKVVMGTLARILLEEDLLPTIKCDMLIVSYIHIIASAMESLGKSECGAAMDEIDKWARSEVTEKEFCNGHK